MSEVFTDVIDSAYVLGSFWIPRNDDRLKVVAVKASILPFIVALYSLLVVFLISFLFRLVMKGMLFVYNGKDFASGPSDRNEISSRKLSDTRKDGEKEAERSGGIAVVGFWNAQEPLPAMLFLFEYLTTFARPRGMAFILFVVVVLAFSGSNAASIIISGKLSEGTYAPARASSVYIADLGKAPRDNVNNVRLQSQRAPAALRAIGSAEAGRVTSQEYVDFDFDNAIEPLSEDEPMFAFNYAYSVTGKQMGLWNLRGLKQEVKGRCVTEYGWHQDYNKDDDEDVYELFGNPDPDYKAYVPRDGERRSAPRAISQMLKPKGWASNYTYAIIPFTSHRLSFEAGMNADPWYLTEDAPSDTTANDDPPKYRVKAVRPILSCWQTDTWTDGGTEFDTVHNLSDPDLITMPKGWWTLILQQYNAPKIVDIINSAGASALVSSMTYFRDGFDAKSSSIMDDMIRLYLATYIATTHTFRNTVLNENIDTSLFPNAAYENGDPQKGIDAFVVSTPQVVAIRFSILVGIPVTLVALQLLHGIELLARYCSRGSSPGAVVETHEPWETQEEREVRDLQKAQKKTEHISRWARYKRRVTLYDPAFLYASRFNQQFKMADYPEICGSHSDSRNGKQVLREGMCFVKHPKLLQEEEQKRHVLIRVFSPPDLAPAPDIVS